MAVRILEESLVNKIAAGEVVERPASVVKELVENALDAGATELRVHLRAGGRNLVRIVDDGSGMDRTDALMCLERHATSKIRTDDDLFRVSTLGFRGEAIPSIASVSKFELLTRTRDTDTGTRVVVEGGKLLSVDPAGAAPGTDISVGSLFYNVPARRKFLRSVDTEMGHCIEAITRELLVRPHVDLEVTHDDRVALRCVRTTELPRRAAELLGPHGEALVPVSFSRGTLRVHGLVSPVGVHRQSATGASYLYVNGRFVRDMVVRRAVTQAYAGLVPKDRYPVVILQVEVPPADVDVNVHPAKTEVRFVNAYDLQSAVAEGLRGALQDHGIQRPVTTEARYRAPGEPQRTQLRLEAPVVAEPVGGAATGLPPGSVPLGEPVRAAGSSNVAGRAAVGVSGPTTSTSTSSSSSSSSRSFGATAAPSGPSAASTGAVAAVSPAAPSPESPARVSSSSGSSTASTAPAASFGGGSTGAMDPRLAGPSTPAAPPPAPAPSAAPPAAEPRLAAPPPPPVTPLAAITHRGRALLPVPRFRDLRVIGQLSRTYILCEGGGEMVIIDQHAAAERITLTRLQRDPKSALGGSQRLLTPRLVELGPARARVLASHADRLAAPGLDISHLGGGTVAVHGLPAPLANRDLDRLLADVADDLAEGGAGGEPQAVLDLVLATLACHTSVRANQLLDDREMRALVEQLDDVDHAVCAHGRPVAIRLDVAELERRFHRS